MQPPRLLPDRERQQLMARTFVDLVGAYTPAQMGFEGRLDLLCTRAAQLLRVEAAGVLVADERGELHVRRDTGLHAHVVQVLETVTRQGPCIEAYESGEAVRCRDLTLESARWPDFAEVAQAAGFVSVYAVPVRVRTQRFGSFNLFGGRPDALDQAGEELAQALADVTALAMLHDRSLVASQEESDQLQGALNSRVPIEQAKGMVASRRAIDVDEAFALIRSYARSTNAKLVDTAQMVIDGRLTDELIDAAVPAPGRGSRRRAPSRDARHR